MCKTYNGYTNYETWDVSLWIDNEQWLYNEINYLAEDSFNNADADKYRNKEEVASDDLADKIKEIIESQNPLIDQASMFSDLLGAALDNVNWQEIAENWIETIKENRGDDD